MFGFGRSAELDKRERALNMREWNLNQKELELSRKENAIRLREQNLSTREIELENRIKEATKSRDLYQSEMSLLSYTRAQKLAYADEQAEKILTDAQEKAESLRLKGYREGKLAGLKSGKKSYWDMEKERDAALKRAGNARHAAIRRANKALRATKQS